MGTRAQNSSPSSGIVLADLVKHNVHARREYLGIIKQRDATDKHHQLQYKVEEVGGVICNTVIRFTR